MVSSPASLPLTFPPAHLSFTGSLKRCSEAQSDHFTSVSSPSLSPSFSGVKASCLSLVLRALRHPRLPFQLSFLPLSTSNRQPQYVFLFPRGTKAFTPPSLCTHGNLNLRYLRKLLLILQHPAQMMAFP